MFLKKKYQRVYRVQLIKLLLCYGVMMGGFLEVMGQKPELVVPIGHTDAITSIAYSHDGKYIATSSGDHTAKLWNAKSGQEIRTFVGHNDEIYDITISSNGKYVITGGIDQSAGRHTQGESVKVWDIQSGKEIKTFAGFSQTKSVDVSSNNQYILAGGLQYAQIWDFRNGTEVSKFTGHTSTVLDATFSPDDKLVLTGSADKTAKLWHAQSGQLIRTFTGHTSEVSSVIFSPDGSMILTGSGDQTAKLWDIVSGKEIKKFAGHTSYISDLAFSSNGKYIVTGSWDQTAKLWDVQSGTEIKTFAGHPQEMVTTVAFSPDNKYIVTGSSDHTAKLWDIQSFREIGIFTGHADPISKVAFSEDSKYIFSGGTNIMFWDTHGSKNITAFQRDINQSTTINFSTNASAIIMGNLDGSVELWDPQKGKITNKLVGHSLWVTASTFSFDDSFLLTGSWDNTAKLWGLQSGRELRTFEGHSSWVTAVNFSPDNRYVLTGSRDKTAILWNKKNGEKIKVFSGHTSQISAVTFSSDGNCILTGSEDRTTKLWDIKTGEVIKEFLGHSSWITSAIFSPNDEYVLTASRDKTAILWDAYTGKIVNKFSGHTSEIYTTAFSSNGQYVLTGSKDNTTKIWNLQGQELATLISVDSTDWIVTTPSGLFDASPGAMKLMHFVQGLEIIELEQLKERYYEPGLLAKIMGYQEGGVRDVEVFDNVKLYPEIQAEITNQQLTINLTERNGGIGKVSVFINDKEVIQDANEGRTEKLQIDLAQFSKYYLADTTNQIAIRAYNDEGWLKSQAYTLDYESPKSAAINTAPPSLYAVVVGTAEYNGDRLDLSFSDQDATAMAEALQGAGGGLFEDRVNVALLNTDPSSGSKAANKTNIQAAFKAFAKEANPQDVLIVYFSGHGITYGSSETAQFYYLTKDIFSEDLSDPEIRNQYAISTNELTTWINDIPAQKQVMILDACNSGRAVDDLLIAQKELNSTQIRALDRMKDRTGMFILAGSAADKASFEASQYGQGLLTYSLLSGMSGLALTDDKRIDVMKLFQYSRDQVPVLAKDIGGIQTPVLAFPYGGSSFDIGIVKEGTEIPVSEAKHVFIRSRLSNADTFLDDLGLENKLNEYFRDLADRKSGDLLYVDVNEYAQAYSIRGQYQLSGDEVKLRCRLFQNKENLGDIVLTGDKSNIDGLVNEIVREAGQLLR